MDENRVLLVDLRQYESSPGIRAQLSEICHVDCLPRGEPLGPRIADQSPCALFFDYDFPDVERLAVLTEARRSFAWLPVVMAAEEESVALAVWALRSRVWDFFLKPVSSGELSDTVLALASLKDSIREQRAPCFPRHALPDEARFHSEPPERRRLAPALQYIRANLARRITQKDAAEACGMGVYQFSRSFKRTFKLTFQDYVMVERMESARRLLRNREASISEICWATGFRDVSYFSRTFRRHFRQSPSDYRAHWQWARAVRGTGDSHPMQDVHSALQETPSR